MAIGIYIHVPFCVHKCNYCDFYSFTPTDEDVKERYVKALCNAIKAYGSKNRIEADTVFFGGGTPTVLSPRQLSSVLDCAADSFNILPNCEITLEANPDTVSLDEMRQLRTAGFNRISFGVQSSYQNELSRLNRIHTFERAQEAIRDARAAGFDSISADMMLGIPEQTVTTAKRTAERLVALGVDHLSAYMLKLEKKTYLMKYRRMFNLPDEDDICDMYLEIADIFERNGLLQHEISNFAKEGHQSRHNLKYWNCDDYLGIGPAAHSCFSGRRFFIEPDVENFITTSAMPEMLEITEDEYPSTFIEYMMLRLRLTEGIVFEDMIKRYGRSVGQIRLDVARKYADMGLVKLTDKSMSFTKEGFLLSNRLIYELVFDVNEL